jgi:hypothetical protein
VGDRFKCPEGHEATILWISEDKKAVAVKCPQKHLGKVRKVADHTKPTLPYRHQLMTKRQIYLKNMVPHRNLTGQGLQVNLRHFWCFCRINSKN